MKEEFYSTQINMSQKLSELMDLFINKFISSDNITHKIEDEFHCTILYGLNFPTLSEIRNCIEEYGKDIITFKLGEVNIWPPTENSYDSDIVHIQVISKDLEDLHNIIKDNIDNEQTFPTYKPHITLTYVKHNSSNDVRGLIPFQGLKFNISTIVLSDPNWKHTKIKL